MARYEPAGVVLVRAGTCPDGLDLPADLDLLGDADVDRGLAWLGRVFENVELRRALAVASPPLLRRVRDVLGATRADPRQVRRLVISVACYVLRWRHRPTPFGLFAGVATAEIGDRLTVQWKADHHVAARADADWVAGIVERCEAHPGLLERLTVVRNDSGSERGDRFVVPLRAPLTAGSGAAVAEVSVQLTRPLRAALAAAGEPLPFTDLAALLERQFPDASPEHISGLLRGLVSRQLLLTNLRAPMTVHDPLAQVIAALEEAGATEFADLAELVKDLTDIDAELTVHNSAPDGHTAEMIRAALTTRMLRLSKDSQSCPLTVDLGLDCRITLPDAVIREAERAAAVLLRLSANPFGAPAWKAFHARFRSRYGAGAVVTVRELVGDSGLGLPAGFQGSAFERAERTVSPRDETILNLVQRASLAGDAEIELTESVIAHLEVGDSREALLPSRLELAFRLHAPSAAAVASGDFRLEVTGAPRPASSMAGRFAHLLNAADQQLLATTYEATEPGVRAVQLSFAPRRVHNENVARVPRLLPTVIGLGEHRGSSHDVIPLDDLAVTADSRQLHLVRISTGERLLPRVPHALEATIQTPPLARFLAEVAESRRTTFGPFDWGAARRLPYLPRLRYGRVVLSAARWLLSAADLSAAECALVEWEVALDAWRARLRVPADVVVCEGEQRLRLDLDRRSHRCLLRVRLERAGEVELREAGDDDGWSGRPCEFLVPMRLKGAAVHNVSFPRRPADTASVTAALPGPSDVLCAQVFGHPARQAEILTDHLPRLFERLRATVTYGWFDRQRDMTRPTEDPDLQLFLRLSAPSQYTMAMQVIAGWADDLRRRGLVAGMSLGTYRPQTGRFGGGAAMRAAEAVFAADSAAAIAQLDIVQRAQVPEPALTAAGLVELATSYLASVAQGLDWLMTHLTRERGRLDPSLRDTALRLCDPQDDWAAIRALRGGDAVATAWLRRGEALASYRRLLAEQRDAVTVLPSLVHLHHRRSHGADWRGERISHRLARAAALRLSALGARAEPR